MIPLWFIFSMGAAASWGLNYVVTEKTLHEGLSLYVLMFLNGIVLSAFSLAFLLSRKDATIQSNIDLVQTGQVPLWTVVVYLITAFIGWFCINYAVLLRNATSVSIVEIAYPLFVIFFTWAIFKEAHLNPYVLLGGGMILGGSMLMLWKG